MTNEDLNGPKITNSPWRPNLDDVANVEHRKCLKLAYDVSNEVARQNADYIKQLDTLPTFDALWAEKAFLGVERSSRVAEAGELDGIPYIIKIIREDRLGHSRASSDDAEKATMVPVGAIAIRLEAKSDTDAMTKPTYELEIHIEKYYDESATRPLEVMVSVPMSGKTARTGGGGIAVAMTAKSDHYIPKKTLTLREVAMSSDPEHGAYALGALIELLSMAKSKLRQTPKR